MRTRMASIFLLALAAGCEGTSGSEVGEDDLIVGEPSRRRSSHCPVDDAGACRSVEPRDVATISSGALQMPGFSYADQGHVVALGARYTDGRVVTASTADRKTFAPILPLPWLGGDVTGADVGGRKTLYFMTSTGAGVVLGASSLEGLAVYPPVAVTIEGASITPYWPQAAALPNGQTLLAFVESQKRAFLAVDDGSGVRFRARPWPNVTGDLRGVLAHVGATNAGSWVITHQVADANWLFTSYVQLSKDGGATWSAPSNIQPDDTNVHDAFPIARADSGADIYYLHSGAANEFNVYRRALHEDGSLGPEQAVTAGSVGHVEKPQARRLPDGKIALMFAIRTAPNVYDLSMAFLAGDAPP